MIIEKKRIAIACLMVASGAYFQQARGDWPGLLGPSRNGHSSPGEVLPSTIPKSLKILWQIPAGQGYAGPSVSENHVVVFERNGDRDNVRLIDRLTGKALWNRDLIAAYRGGMDSDKGPRSVPTVLSTSILIYSAAGELSRLSRDDGSVIWTRKLGADYAADGGYFGAGTTPLVVDETVIINVGGKQAGIVCVALKDGETLWKATEADASYSSPIVIDSASGAIAVVPTRLKTYALRVSNGERVWETPFGQRGPTVNAATPILTGNSDIFLTASYGIGSVLLRPREGSVDIVARGNEISSQYATPVSVGDYIFGSDGREDTMGASFKCIHAQTGKLQWEETGMPVCHTIVVGGPVDRDGNNSQTRLLVVGIDGRLWCLKPSEKSFDVIWTAELPKGSYRALPAFSRGNLIVRNSDRANSQWISVELK